MSLRAALLLALGGREVTISPRTSRYKFLHQENRYFQQVTPEKLAKSALRWAAPWNKLIKTLHNRFCPTIAIAEIFPSIEDEFAPYKEFFKGNILNAGAGNRDISHLVVGTLFNQDIPTGLHNANIHIFAPLHKIPKPSGFFDTIICNAVIEHVRNPHEVMDEFARVCKPGGYLYLGIPFMQPEHKDPTDFQRYTKDGICELVDKHGFDVIRVEGVHSVYVTLAWFCREWLNSKRTVTYFLLKLILFPYLKRKCLTSRYQVESLQSCYRVLARRRVVAENLHEGPSTEFNQDANDLRTARYPL